MEPRIFCQPTDVQGLPGLGWACAKLLAKRTRSRLATALGGWIFLGDGDVHSISVTSNWPNSLQMARTVDIGVGWQPGVVY
jgi:hypothetical protein